MKKLSLVLALIMALTCFTFVASAEGDNMVYSFKFADEIAFGQGRNGQCYFPNPERAPGATFPEIYTWGSGTLNKDGDVTKVTTTSSNGIMFEFDSIPAGMNFSKEMPFMAIALKTSGPVDSGFFKFVAQGGARYGKTFDVKTTGEWDVFVVDLRGKDGWVETQNGGTEATIAPWDEGKIASGGFRIDFAPSFSTFHVAAIGFFKTEDAAKAYNYGLDGIKFGSSTAPAPSTPSTPSTPDAPKEEEWEPTIFNAVKKEEEKPVSAAGDFKSIAPAGFTKDDDKVIIKITEVSGAAGAYQTPIAEVSKINTWSGKSVISIEGGLLKAEQSAMLEFTANKHGITANSYPYVVIGYKSAEDAGGEKSTYIYGAGNTIRSNIRINLDGEWHYDIFDLKAAQQKKNGDAWGDASGENLSFMRLDIINSVITYVDFIAAFKTEDAAKAYADEAVKNLANQTPAEEETPVEEETGFSYIKGYDDNTFKPNKNMTRAEAITVIARLVAASDEEAIKAVTETKFADAKEHWGKSYIAYLESFGMLKNYKDNIEPNKNITRAEFIKLCADAKAFEYSNKQPSFSDLTRSHPYYRELCLGYAAGAITGYTDGTIKPDKEITRAEIVTIVNRILEIPASESAPTFTDIADHWACGNIMAAVGK